MTETLHTGTLDVGHDDIIKSLGRLEAGMDESQRVLRDVLAEQRKTNGHVRELREWRVGHDVETEARLASWRESRQQHATLANRVNDLIQMEERRLADARAAAKQRKRLLAAGAAVGAVLSAFGSHFAQIIKFLAK